MGSAVGLGILRKRKCLQKWSGRSGILWSVPGANFQGIELPEDRFVRKKENRRCWHV